MNGKANLFAVAAVSLALTGHAQTTGRLSRVIPDLYGPHGLIVDSLAPLPTGETHSAHFNSAFQSQFTQFNIALASQVASVPIPSPASGFTYTFDPKTGVFVRSTDSFGPIFAERAETIGRHKISLGFNYQRFTFDQIEGIDLGDIPAVFTHDNPAPGGKSDVVTTRNRIDATVDQFTGFFTVGLSDKFDLTLALPISHADLSVTSLAQVERIGTTDPLIHFFDDNGQPGTQRTYTSEGSASGIGDIHLLVKARLWKWESVAAALGLDVRFPSGDVDDLLGIGALGVRPFAAVSSSHKSLSLHLNASYEWNGKSVLAGDLTTRHKEDIPDRFHYVGGVDFAVSKQVTLAFDLLTQVVIDSPRLSQVQFRALDGHTTFDDIAFTKGTVSETNLAAGVKLNLAPKLLIDLNATIALDDAGLRDNFTPLIGVEYSF